MKHLPSNPRVVKPVKGSDGPQDTRTTPGKSGTDGSRASAPKSSGSRNGSPSMGPAASATVTCYGD